MVYTVSTGPEMFDAHDEFAILTQPLVGHSLCGVLSYTATLNGAQMYHDAISYNSLNN